MSRSHDGGHRILFFLDPVVFRQDPGCLAPHIIWVELIEQVADHIGGEFALAANSDVCEKWRAKKNSNGYRTCFPLQSFEPLEAFNYSRANYAKALYGADDIPNSLTTALHRVREMFAPDLIVTTCQNSIAQRAFAPIPFLYLEQAPLPRLDQKLRTYFDPCGHQVGSLLESRASEIKSIALTREDRDGIIQFLRLLKEKIGIWKTEFDEAVPALDRAKRTGKVAILAAQPPDWPTYEGAYDAVALEDLLYQWGRRLPLGWIGVPTYHPHYRLNPNTEEALARACPNLRFLPTHLAQGLTEILISRADGLVTLSSTSAATALLFGKKVIVCGTSPLNGWCPRDVEKLDSTVPLTDSEAASMLAFLSNRYCYNHEELISDPAIVAELISAVMKSDDPSRWFFDLSDWSRHRAERLFKIWTRAAST